MQIAAEHSETVGQRARVGVEERFLFDGIALHSAHVAPGDMEHAALVVAHFANAGLTVRNGTAVTTGVAAHPVAIQLLVQIAFTDILIDDVAQGGHKNRASSCILDRFFRDYREEEGRLAKLLSQSLACCCAASTWLRLMREARTATRYLLAWSPPACASTDQ